MDQVAPTTPLTRFSSTRPQSHRGRMRTRLLAGSTALADYEILEMLLFLGIPRRDTRPIAKGLVNRFGSLAGVLAADRTPLEAAGLPTLAINAIAFVTEAARELTRVERTERKLLNDWGALVQHLNPLLRSQQPAGLSVLLLNNRNQLLDEVTLDATSPAFITRTLLQQALQCHASAAILVRNRGGEPADLLQTDENFFAPLRQTAASLSITLYDLITIGQGDWRSLRAQAREPKDKA